MHQQPGVSIMFFTSGRLPVVKLEPYEREFAHLQVGRRKDLHARFCIFLVTSRRISRITSVERNLKK
jgi:hypothetical protein